MLAYLGALLAHLGAMLARLGAMLAHLGGYVGPSWGYVGPSWGYVGPSWGHVGPTWTLFWAYCREAKNPVKRGMVHGSAVGVAAPLSYGEERRPSAMPRPAGPPGPLAGFSGILFGFINHHVTQVGLCVWPGFMELVNRVFKLIQWTCKGLLHFTNTNGFIN